MKIDIADPGNVNGWQLAQNIQAIARLTLININVDSSLDEAVEVTFTYRTSIEKWNYAVEHSRNE